MQRQLRALTKRLLEISDLESVAALLDWDRSTYMPSGGAEAHVRQIGYFKRLAHEKLTAPAVGRMLDGMRAYEQGLPYDGFEASLIRVLRRDYELAAQVPAQFMARLESHIAESLYVWSKARPANDFATLAPYLQKMLDLTHELASFFPGHEDVADPVIRFVTQDDVRANEARRLLGQLRQQLVPLAQAIAAQPAPDDACLHHHYPQAQQLAFGLEVIGRFGYDLQRGRQDLSPHPFSTAFSWGDVRITTRVNEFNLAEALFGTLHEGGHGLYDQGIERELYGTPLGRGASSGLHESQSRLWENIVGRSRDAWQFFYPRLQAAFPDQLRSTGLDSFHRAINRVQPSLIRVGADEVTYNLHIALRFEMEMDLLEGRLAVRDLPEAWRERFKAALGIIPPDNRDGVIQDLHWFGRPISAAYVVYTLGDLAGAQFFEAAVQAHPEIPSQMREGRFDTLLAWLRENVHKHGRKYTASELIQRATGKPLSAEPLLRYLRLKYGQLYGIRLD